MRKISAHLILDGRGKCYSRGVLTIGSDGTILDILDTGGQLTEQEGVEFFSGMLVPGFVNAHCHLELSHLKGACPEGAGLVPFLKSVVEKRYFEDNIILEAAEKADVQMYKQGIVAVGDIANGMAANSVKIASRIHYQTFVEALGFSPQRAERAFEWAKNCQQKLEMLTLASSIVPHAPYSVSDELFRLIALEAGERQSILSIHSQESSVEDDLFLEGSGEMMGHLLNNLAIDTSFFVPTGKKALQQTLKWLPKDNPLLLVHNLFTSQEDLNAIRLVREMDKTWFVLCPASNLFIQNKLPNIKMFRGDGLQICLGTDSLASNHQLSMVEEMRILQEAFPEISLDELITWACTNGANALGIEGWAGSIEVGKKPGINLLTGMDLGAKLLLKTTQVKKIC